MSVGSLSGAVQVASWVGAGTQAELRDRTSLRESGNIMKRDRVSYVLGLRGVYFGVTTPSKRSCFPQQDRETN